MSDSESSISSNKSEDDEHKNKRRKREPQTWKRNRLPALKAMGKEHIGWKGRLVPKRVTGNDCK